MIRMTGTYRIYATDKGCWEILISLESMKPRDECPPFLGSSSKSTCMHVDLEAHATPR